MTKHDIIDLIYRAMLERRRRGDPAIKDVQLTEGRAAKVIIVTEEGGHKEWVISPAAIKLLEDDDA